MSTHNPGSLYFGMLNLFILVKQEKNDLLDSIKCSTTNQTWEHRSSFCDCSWAVDVMFTTLIVLLLAGLRKNYLLFKLGGRVGHRPRKNSWDFRTDPDKGNDPRNHFFFFFTFSSISQRIIHESFYDILMGLISNMCNLVQIQIKSGSCELVVS